MLYIIPGIFLLTFVTRPASLQDLVSALLVDGLLLAGVVGHDVAGYLCVTLLAGEDGDLTLLLSVDNLSGVRLLVRHSIPPIL